jgi:hypothetical protein
MFIKNSQQDIDFTIDPQFNKVGIKISGGADSAIICYMLSKYKATERSEITIHPITAVNILKPYQLIFSKKVIEFCEKEFDIKFNEHLYSDPVMEGPDLQAAQDKLLNDAFDYGIIDCHISGINCNPPIEVCNSFNEAIIDERDFRRDRTDELKSVMPGYRAYRPFANLDKKGIKELYDHFDLMDTLFPITKSCEAKTYDWSTPHCGTCWWCHERRWGFGRLI